MKNLENPDLYEVLGVGRDATQAEIKKAYRNKAKQNHEDRGGEKETMILINRAWSVLKDPIKRKHYDETGEESSFKFEEKFSALIQKLFFKVISESPSIEHTDLIKNFKSEIQSALDKQLQQLEEIEAVINKLQKVMDRVSVKKGENHIGNVLNMNMLELKKHQKAVEIDISFFKDALEVAEHYKYDFQEQEASEDDIPLYFRHRGFNINGM